jgi:hypothetical protein
MLMDMEQMKFHPTNKAHDLQLNFRIAIPIDISWNRIDSFYVSDVIQVFDIACCIARKQA